jgi:hypothetical protein
MKKLHLHVKPVIILFAAAMLFSFNCSSTPKSNGKIKITDLLTAQQFNALFPMHNTFYSYSAFVKAAGQLGRIKIKVTRRAASVYQLIRTDETTEKSTIVRQDNDWNEAWAKAKPDSVYYIDFGMFCTEKSLAIDKKELAAFFAQIAHETRHGEDGKYNDGLMLTHEINTALPYIADNDDYPAVTGKKYYGRGPMQLSYNGNYGYASVCIFGDKNLLLNNPDLVENDPVTAFKTAIYFWMTPQPHKPSAHNVMIGKWQPSATQKAKGLEPGFGMTINIINGPVECGKGDNMESMNDRIGFYQYFLKKLGVSDPNCACSCGKMQAL